MTDYPMMQWTPERIRAFWDYESRFPERYFTYKAGSALVTRLSPFTHRHQTVLDYACGMGHLTAHLLAAGYRVAATDISPESLAAVSTRFAGYGTFDGAFAPETLVADRRRFGTIFVCELIEHLNDDDLDALMAQLPQLLGRQGTILFTTPNDEPLAESDVLCPCCRQVFHRWQHVRSWTQGSLRAYLQAHGLEVIECFAGTFSGRPAGRLRRLARHFRPKRKGTHLVAVCRRA